MDSVAKRDPEDSAKIKAIEQKLLANPEIAKLIDGECQPFCVWGFRSECL